MPSAKFTNPKNGDTIAANAAFTISMAIKNMETGNFVNAQENYFAAPQQLNKQGQIIGHSHVVVEALQSLTQTTPTDAKSFVFFKVRQSVGYKRQYVVHRAHIGPERSRSKRCTYSRCHGWIAIGQLSFVFHQYGCEPSTCYRSYRSARVVGRLCIRELHITKFLTTMLTATLSLPLLPMAKQAEVALSLRLLPLHPLQELKLPLPLLLEAKVQLQRLRVPRPPLLPGLRPHPPLRQLLLLRRALTTTAIITTTREGLQTEAE